MSIGLSFPRSHFPVEGSLEKTLTLTARPSGVMYATHPFLDQAILLFCISLQKRPRQHLRATPACAELVQPSREAFDGRWADGIQDWERDRLGIPKEIVDVHAVVCLVVVHDERHATAGQGERQSGARGGVLAEGNLLVRTA